MRQHQAEVTENVGRLGHAPDARQPRGEVPFGGSNEDDTPLPQRSPGFAWVDRMDCTWPPSDGWSSPPDGQRGARAVTRRAGHRRCRAPARRWHRLEAGCDDEQVGAATPARLCWTCPSHGPQAQRRRDAAALTCESDWRVRGVMRPAGSSGEDDGNLGSPVCVSRESQLSWVFVGGNGARSFLKGCVCL